MDCETFIKLILNVCELGYHGNLKIYRDETIMDVVKVLYPEEFNKRLKELTKKESEE